MSTIQRHTIETHYNFMRYTYKRKYYTEKHVLMSFHVLRYFIWFTYFEPIIHTQVCVVELGNTLYIYFSLLHYTFFLLLAFKVRAEKL